MTPRFRFRLEPVLELRERREEVAQQDLGQALAAVAAQQERAVAAERALATQIEGLRRMQREPAALHVLRAKHEDVTRARLIAEHEREGVRRMEDVAAERQAELVRASQEREALSQLRRRQEAAYRAEQGRLEGVVLDELALRRHRRAATASPGLATA